MNVLVLGSGGLLGSNVVTEALNRDMPIAGTYHSRQPSLGVSLDQFDIRDADAFPALLDSYDPTVVINCAAMTDVDECEKRPERATDINGEAPGRLAEICRDRGVSFVQVSTDYVFDGESDRIYDETAPTDPIQTYGATKLRGEETVKTAHEDALVPRLSFVWGVHQAMNELTGFPAWVRDRLAAGKATPLFTDQYVTPSRARAAAKTIFDLVQADQNGTFHVTSNSCLTPYDFGKKICERLGADYSLIETGSQTDLDRPATRPAHTCLDVAKVETTLNRSQPTVDADLDAVESLL